MATPMKEPQKLKESLRLMSGHACEACPLALTQAGIDIEDVDHVVALAGNPNTGKSTIFNALTGLRQHTGNWPGKTVTRAEGAFKFGGKTYKVVDLPGTYSLLSASTDEEVARDFILFGRPDCTIVVVDATALERNLNLVLQVLEITDRVVVALNLVDEAARKGIQVDHRRLARELGVPVVPTVAKSGQGMGNLLQAVEGVISGAIRTRPHHLQGDRAFQQAVDRLAQELTQLYPGLPSARWVAMRLLDGDPRIQEAVRTGELARIARGDTPALGAVPRYPLTLEEVSP